MTTKKPKKKPARLTSRKFDDCCAVYGEIWELVDEGYVDLARVHPDLRPLMESNLEVATKSGRVLLQLLKSLPPSRARRYA